jgi:O-antigen ligase
MVVNIVQTTDHARKLLLVQAVSCVLICAIAVYEQSHPGGVIVPGWIEFTGTMEVRGEGVRVGSTFLDYELLAEYCALNLVLQLFMWVRATSQSRRVAVTLLMALTLFVLFATVTRGALVALGVGLLYLGWLSRKRLNFPTLVIGVAAVVAVIGTADWAVSTFTRSKSVLQRLEKTEFVGVVPESRVGAWEYAIRNISEHPIIGHGPFYSTESGVVARYWTHNVYLYYASIVGVVGLAAFLWFLWRLWWANARRAPSMGSGSYIAGFSLTTRVVLLVFIVDQLKIDYLRNERYSFFIWFLLGLIAAVSRVATEEAAVVATHSTAPPERVPFPALHAGNSPRRQVRRVAVAHAAGEDRP